MKKSVFFAALAALVLAGCAKNEIYVNVANNDEVSFSAYSGRTITKAGCTDDMNLAALKKAEAGFGVFATYSGTDDFTEATDNFMTNEKITWDDTKNAWTYSPVKYWPNPTNGKNADQQKVSFFAYAPYAVANPSEPGIQAFGIDATTKHNYVQYGFSNAKGVHNVDLMWGYKNGWDKASTIDADRVQLNRTRTEESIHFVFRHVLSKLGGSQEGAITDPEENGYVANGLIIKANAETIKPTNSFGAANGTKITVSKIIVESAPEEDPAGTPVKDANGNDVKYATGIQTGKLDLFTGDFQLDNAAEAVQFTQTLTNDPAEVAAGTADSQIADFIAEPASFAAFGELPKGVTETAVNVYKDESSPIILVPGTAPVVDVTITYFVRTYDEKLPLGYTDVPQTVWGRVKFPTIQPNKKYNLLMILGLNDVKFEATVEDWTVVGSTWNDANGNGIVDEGEIVGLDQEIGLPDNLPLLDLVSSAMDVTIDGTGNATLNNIYRSAAGAVTITSVTPAAGITLDTANKGLVLAGVAKGTYVIQLASAGDATHAPAARTLTLTVIGAANSFDLAATKTVTVDANHDGVTDALYSVAEGAVTMESATKNYIDAAGFSFDASTKKVTLDDVAPGEYVLTFKAAGDNFHEEAVKSLTLTVN